MRRNLSLLCILTAIVALSSNVSAQSRLFSRLTRTTTPERGKESGAFSVRAFQPSGETKPGGGVVVFFTADAVSSETLQTTRTAESVVTFNPAIDGMMEWQTPRILRLIPRTPLRLGTEYVAKVNPELRDIKGQRLQGTTEFKFRTTPLRMIKAEQAGFTPERRAILQLKFTDEVAPTDLQKYLSIQSGGSPLAWQVESDVKSAAPRVLTDPILTETLTLYIEPGLHGVSGPLGITSRIEEKIEPKFRLIAEQVNGAWENARPSLRIRFSNPVRLEDFNKFIKIEPNVPFELGSEWHTVILNGDFKPDHRYTVTISKGVQGTNGELLLNDASMSVTMPPIRPFVELVEAGGHLSPDGSMKLRVKSATLKSFRLTARRIFDNNTIVYALTGQDDYNAARWSAETASREISVTNPSSTAISQTDVNLRDVLGAKATGTYLVTAEGAFPLEGGGERGDEDFYGSSDNSAIIAVSNLGIVAKQSDSQLTVWVGALNTAKPQAGAKVQAWTSKNQPLKEGTTDANGFVTFSDMAPGVSQPRIVTASAGDDSTFLDMEKSLAGAEAMKTEGRAYVQRGYEAFLSSDRGAYRPGEVVHLFGFVRNRTAEVPQQFPLELQIQRPGNRMSDPIPVTFGPNGLLTIDVPTANYSAVGLYRAHLQLAGTARKHEEASKRPGSGRWSDANDETETAEQEELGQAEFFVEEFLPNHLKVVTEADERPFTTTEPLKLKVSVEEMFGQPAAGREISPVVLFKAGAFTPPAFKGYTFGDPNAVYPPIENELPDVTASADGRAALTIPMPENVPPTPLKATVQVIVKDVGGRSVTSRILRTANPVASYIGARLNADTFAKVGAEAKFDVVNVAPDGTLVDSAPLTATISSVRYNSILRREDGGYTFVTKRELVLQKDFKVATADGRGSLSWTPLASGSYELRVADPTTRAIAVVDFYASDQTWSDQPWSMEKPEQLELALDKAQYAPGDTARLLVKAPFAGTLLLTLEQDHVLSSSVIEMTQNTMEIPVPVTADLLPNTYCVAWIVRPVKPAEKWLPHRAYGLTNLSVGHELRQLAVEFKAPTEVLPNSHFVVPMSVKDVATSKPVATDVIVWAEDEGVLTLTGFETPNPADFFYGLRKLMVKTADFFSDLMPDIIEKAAAKSAAGGDGSGEGRRKSPVSSERVKPVTIWLGTISTDADGSATASFSVPQFMGRLRVMGVAAKGNSFGNGDATVFVRNPVMVKESLPRFLAPGDKAVSPFIVYNNTDTAQPVKFEAVSSGTIAVGCPGTAELPCEPVAQGMGAKLDVAPRGQKVVPVSLTTADCGAKAADGKTPCVGQAVVTYTATMGNDKYSDKVQIPVRPASPEVRHALYDVIPAGETKKLELAGGPYVEGTVTGSLVVSKLPAVQLAGALDYLLRYPYGCLEQTVSSAFPQIYLKDLAETVKGGGMNESAIRQNVQGGVDRILSMQVASGGLSMWQNQRAPWTWGTVYAAHFLVEAQKAGYDVPPAAMDELMKYLSVRLLSSDLTMQSADILTERCYACYVLALAGHKETSRMEGLFEMRKDLTPSARALLACAYATAGAGNEAATLLSVPHTFETTTVRETGGILSSPTRETALLLSAALESNAAAAEIPALVKRLESTMKHEGHWGTTQDNAFALWALGKYLARTASQKADFRGSVLLANGEKRPFTSTAPLVIPATELGASTSISVEGEGRAYVAWNEAGVPLKPDMKPVSQGMTITRRYKDRSGDDLDPQALEQGQTVVVEITLDAGRALENVVIEDLLPAGLEIENQNLQSAEHDEESDKPSAITIQRTEARDDRMVAFVDVSSASKPKPRRARGRASEDEESDDAKGPATFSYVTRAVTQGTFTLPPVQASAMYDPDVRAMNGAGTVNIVPRKASAAKP